MGPEIIAIGEPMLEFNATGEGSLAEVSQFETGWGGDTSNFCIAASRSGGRVGYFTRLGDDDFGESFLALWAREGIDTTFVQRDPEAFTGIYFISRRGQEHFFTYYRKGSAASRMTPESLPLDYIRSARILHISGISQAISTTACDTIFAAVQEARNAGVKVSYDPNLRLKLWPIERARAVIDRTIALSDLVFPSLEDAKSLTGLEEPEAIALTYLEMGPEMVVVKLGGEGALVARMSDNGPILSTIPACRVDSVDMAGAGDTFDGAFVVEYLKGRPAEECALYANAAAALTTTGYGCVSPVPARKQIERLMSSR